MDTAYEFRQKLFYRASRLVEFIETAPDPVLENQIFLVLEAACGFLPESFIDSLIVKLKRMRKDAKNDQKESGG